MILSSFHLLFKQYRSSLLRTFVVINQRQLRILKLQKNDILSQSKANQHDLMTFKQKAQQTAKDTLSSLVIIAGVVALGGICSLILHDFYSRETPNGIYNEASKICLSNNEVQQALGLPINVHPTPQTGSIRINNVRAQMFDEKGHRSMTISFYLTGQERSGVVAIKVQKNILNKFVYDYILVQLDRPWRGKNIIQIQDDKSH